MSSSLRDQVLACAFGDFRILHTAVSESAVVALVGEFFLEEHPDLLRIVVVAGDPIGFTRQLLRVISAAQPGWIVKQQSASFRLANGALFHAFGRHTSGARGCSADMVVVMDCDQVPSSLAWDLIIPIATAVSRVICLAHPSGRSSGSQGFGVLKLAAQVMKSDNDSG